MALTSGNRLTQMPIDYPNQHLSYTASSNNPQAKMGKAVHSAPRIDLEPLYIALREAIAESWIEYKEALRLFVLGFLNQDEFSRRINRFICVEPVREHCHNQLISGIFGNASRESPEQMIASWVSANDKPASSLNPIVGDIAEQRLKTEVLMLTARERYRLKSIQALPNQKDNFIISAVENYAAKQIQLPDIIASSAGGLNKTNWDLEIRKRFTQPLFSEAVEFPDSESILARMLPICYEEGITSGCDIGCADLMNIATENYVKELISNILAHIRSNGDYYVKTAAYRQKLQHEEEAWLQGAISKSNASLLPVEIMAAEKRRPLEASDMRLTLYLGDTSIGQSPLLAERLTSCDFIKAEDIGKTYDDYCRDGAGIESIKDLDVSLSEKFSFAGERLLADFATEWPGSALSDRQALSVMLDDCLSIG